jgi:2-dehydro-3-deoxyphosphogalactonate aldolase
MQAFRNVGANGFGIGSALFKPGMTAADVAESAAGFEAAWAGTIRA